MQKLEEIIHLVSQRIGLDIKNPSRKREYVMGRSIYYKLAKDDFHLGTYSSIGALVNKDHTTVLYGLKKFEIVEMYEPKLYEKYLLIKNKIGGKEDVDFINDEAILLKHANKKLQDQCDDLESKYNKLMKDSDENYITSKMQGLSYENQELLKLRVRAMLKMMA